MKSDLKMERSGARDSGVEYDYGDRQKRATFCFKCRWPDSKYKHTHDWRCQEREAK